MDAQDKQDKGQIKTKSHKGQRNEEPATPLLSV